ncbi:hypothetical protein BDZ85DRAFT_264205 [Elsinoe ampelina]|uniref:Structure-specific endonuclease subunit SLX4 n=1 Tax=Elsinoe ampelina TaxID=302913 RepID=A0A6A6G7C2_9PEZI|nr:hypothetical protein BDZ85DRAFT_264205 [Elsinoe ampelina]
MAATLDAPIVLSSSSPTRAQAIHYSNGFRSGTGDPSDIDQPSPSAFLRQTPGHPSSPNMPYSDTISAHWPQSKDAQSGRLSSPSRDIDTSDQAGKLSRSGKKKQSKTEQQHGEGDNELALPDAAVKKAPTPSVKAGTKRKRSTKAAVDETGAPKPRKRVAKAKAQGKDTTAAGGDSGKPKKPTARGRKRMSKEVAPADVTGPRIGKDDTEASHHFNEHDHTADATSDVVTSRRKGKTRAATPIEELGLETAPTRKRSWTPTLEPILPPTPHPMSDGSEGAFMDPDQALTMLKKFGYQGGEAAGSAETMKPAPAKTRKKKVEGAEAVPKRKRAEKKVKEPAVKKVKEPKEPKKPKPPKKPRVPKVVRPKTITDYAISAYRKDPQTNEKAVSEFFQPTATQVVRLGNDPTRILEPEHTLKAPKRMTTTVQFQFPEPQKAVMKMRDQDFLFGTSSQLAKGDSPSTHRMMQRAIHESEDMAFASQALSSDIEQSPTTSRLKVVSAPHGTSLSVGPGMSNLWSRAARDQDARTFVSTPRKQRLTTIGLLPDHEAHTGVMDETVPDEVNVNKINAPAQNVAMDKVGSDNQSRHDSGYVDISDLEPVQVDGEPKIAQVEEARPTKEVIPAQSPAKDDFVLISSSPPVVVPVRHALQDLDVNTPTSRLALSGGLKLSTTAAMASPRKTAAEIVSQLDNDMSGIKRPRGRPRKDSTSTDKPIAPLNSPKRPRGRPRKDAIPSDDFQDIDEVLKRPRGRPRKDSSPPAPKMITKPRQKPQPSSSKRSTSPKAASLRSPATKVTTPKLQRRSTVMPVSSTRDWHDIDEISDSEASAPALSPPRRSASSPPSSPRKLDLAPDPASLTANQAGRAAVAPIPLSLGPTTVAISEEDIQATKAQQQAALFKTISRVVKSALRTTDPTRPSWHEKILMYDPIVLEDLTAWLVGEGVKPDGTTVPAPAPRDSRIALEDATAGVEDTAEQATSGKKAKAGKGKGKGKSKAQEERERKKDELQPWMVQKWCESHSICCLWKEGLRGGVRQRY